METRCANCDILLNLEAERIKSYEKLSRKNIALHKRIQDQQEEIVILKRKLIDKGTTVLDECLMKSLKEMKNYHDELPNKIKYDLEENIKEKLDEVVDYLTVFQSEKESFENLIQEQERYCFENISYLNGLANYFRESLLEEMDNTNKMKQYFMNQMNGIAVTSQDVLIEILNDEKCKIHNQLKQRYKKHIESTQEQIKKLDQLVSALRKHNQDLYFIIQKNKKEYDKCIVSYKDEIKSLQMTIKKLKQRNTHLYNQIKLEVEGCQKDLLDTRKKFREMTEQKCK